MGYILQIFEYKCAFIRTTFVFIQSATHIALCLALSTTVHSPEIYLCQL